MRGDLFKKLALWTQRFRAFNMLMTLSCFFLRTFYLSRGLKFWSTSLNCSLNFLSTSINHHCTSLDPPSLNLSQVSGILHCTSGSFPFTYLGLLLKLTTLSNIDWQPLLDRVKKRLAAWNGHTLSRGGRLVLVNSVLTSLPLYYMLFFFPATMGDRLHWPAMACLLLERGQ